MQYQARPSLVSMECSELAPAGLYNWAKTGPRKLRKPLPACQEAKSDTAGPSVSTRQQCTRKALRAELSMR